VRKSKEIYEHLASVYLDSSQEKKKKYYTSPKSIFKNLVKFTFAGVILCVIIIQMATKYIAKSPPASQLTLILEDSITKINYDFNQAKKEAAVFDLKDMNLFGFKSLGFRLRKGNYRDNLHMRVEFVSGFKEASEIYIKQIPNRWENFKIGLVEFKDIGDWSRMRQLLFIIEEWNAQVKKGTVYIDDVRFLK